MVAAAITDAMAERKTKTITTMKITTKMKITMRMKMRTKMSIVAAGHMAVQEATKMKMKTGAATQVAEAAEDQAPEGQALADLLLRAVQDQAEQDQKDRLLMTEDTTILADPANHKGLHVMEDHLVLMVALLATVAVLLVPAADPQVPADLQDQEDHQALTEDRRQVQEDHPQAQEDLLNQDQEDRPGLLAHPDQEDHQAVQADLVMEEEANQVLPAQDPAPAQERVLQDNT